MRCISNTEEYWPWSVRQQAEPKGKGGYVVKERKAEGLNKARGRGREKGGGGRGGWEECEGQHVKAGSVLTTSHVREPGVCVRLQLLTSPHESHTDWREEPEAARCTIHTRKPTFSHKQSYKCDTCKPVGRRLKIALESQAHGATACA